MVAVDLLCVLVKWRLTHRNASQVNTATVQIPNDSTALISRASRREREKAQANICFLLTHQGVVMMITAPFFPNCTVQPYY